MDQTNRVAIGSFDEFGIHHNAILEQVGLSEDLTGLTAEERHNLTVEVIQMGDDGFDVSFETINGEVAYSNNSTSKVSINISHIFNILKIDSFGADFYNVFVQRDYFIIICDFCNCNYAFVYSCKSIFFS
ncbi:MAG: hypothetical protein ACI8ZM_001782 [Crocinitomix sp.]